jgi:hypothetical protein
MTSALPPDGQPIPTDGAIVLTAKAWTDVYPDRHASELISLVEVSVFDSANVLVPGTVEAWYAGAGASVAWRPLAPLPPNATFRVEGSVESRAPRPANAVGETTLRFQFATAAAPAPPLRLAEGMRVVLETYDHQLQDCGPCGGGCTPKASIRGLRARVSIPTAEGGYTPDGYGAWLWLSDDRPHELPDGRGGALVNPGGFETVAPGRPTEVLLPIPEEDQAYAPCFSLRVFDPSGHFADAPPLCLPRMDVKSTINTLDGKPQPAGCALVGTRQAVGPLAALPMALVVLACGRRARARLRR